MKSILVGNGIDIQFGGKAYSNTFIMNRIMFNVRTGKYSSLFNNMVSESNIENIFKGLIGYANTILSGKYDNLPQKEISDAVHDFKKRFTGKSEFKRYKEIPLEDWFLMLQLFFVDNPDLINQINATKQGFEQMVLDAIFNDGCIQSIYKSVGKKVRKFFNSFDKIFTLNYDNNIEMLCGKEVYHLHGSFSDWADSVNPHTFQGFCRNTSSLSVVVHGFEHCYCNALLHYSGIMKYRHAESNRILNQTICELREQKKNGNPEYSKSLANAKALFPNNASSMESFVDYSNPVLSSNYHFTDFQNLTGELHIIGISPQNDSHIFCCINESNISKVVYYYYDNSNPHLPINKPVEYKKVNDLWNSLDAERPRYNCKVENIPNTEPVAKYIELLNSLSFDPISPKEIEDEMRSIPAFISDPLCREALALMDSQKELKSKKDENELRKQLLSISQIALREGIYPTAFLLMIVNYMNSHKNEL